VHSHQVVQQWREWLLEFYVFVFGPMGYPTVWFDGLYFRPFVRQIISTFNFSANFVFLFICHRHFKMPPTYMSSFYSSVLSSDGD
jgi:hypothetical protein